MPHQYFTRWSVPALAALAIVGSIATANAQTSTVIVAPSAPPPPRVETVPPPPPVDTQIMTWQAGRWAWTGTEWTWVQGHYVERPQATAIWEPGRWAAQPSGGYVWVDGHWRS